jgi:glycosyltransferase involved in cell wall biosynthesis
VEVVHVITGLYQGGAESALLRLVTGPTNEVRHIVVSMIDEGVHGDSLRSQGIELVTLGMPRGRLTFRGMVRLYRLLRRLKPDVVQTWMYHADLIGGTVARFAGCRTVVWGIRHSDFDPGNTSRSTRWTVRLCAIMSSKVPVAIACNSDRAAQVHQDIGYDRKKFRVIRNGYDLSRFRPDLSAGYELREEWNVPPDAPLVGHVARWHPQKDHKTFLRAVALVATVYPDLECVLVGREINSGNTELNSMIESLGLSGRIRLLGPRDDIEKVMNALDLNVMSSAVGEGFPNVVAEAMACGTPCVVTDVGDAPLIVGSTGWVVPTTDPESLAEAIEGALKEKIDAADLWRKRRKAARARVEEEFGIEHMIHEYQALWDDCLRGESGG